MLLAHHYFISAVWSYNRNISNAENTISTYVQVQLIVNSLIPMYDKPLWAMAFICTFKSYYNVK